MRRMGVSSMNSPGAFQTLHHHTGDGTANGAKRKRRFGALQLEFRHALVLLRGAQFSGGENGIGLGFVEDVKRDGLSC